MRRFYSEEITASSKEVVIGGDEFRHLKNVLRLRAGDEVSVFDGKGLELKGVISSIDKTSARVAVSGRVDNGAECAVRLVLMQALLKGDRPELIVRKATELGAASIMFFPAARSVAELKGERAAARAARFKKAAVEAAKQCGRAVVPDVVVCGSFREAVSEVEADLKLISMENETGQTIKDALKTSTAPRGIAVAVGPEGGFDPDEAALAKRSGLKPVSLGPRVLRAETAAIAAVAMVLYEADL